jgi:ligand-binding sensor domain-containing protein/serine phosphatase RsbU (regulator of sigma subunit)
MKFNRTMKTLSITIWCLFLYSAVLNCQTYSFKNFGAESDIPSGFVYTINQSDDGFLWVGTGNGLSRFDGFSFFNVTYPDSVAGRYTTASLKDKNGTLWFGCSDGTVYYSKENELIHVPIINSKSISDLLEGPDGRIYVVPQGKAVFGINPVIPEEIDTYSFSDELVIFSAAFTPSGHLIVGTQENVLICLLNKQSLTVTDTIEGFGYSSITSIHQTDDSSAFIVGTDGNGLFQLRITATGNILKRLTDNPSMELLSVQAITEDAENALWVSTFGSGVYQIQLTEDYESVKSLRHFEARSGLASDDVKSVFQDIEGNYWIGFYGEGLSMLGSYAFSYYKPGTNPQDNNILYVNSYGDKYILGTPVGVHLFDPVAGKSVSFTNLSNGVGKAEITSYFLDNEKKLWIGTGGNGLFARTNSGAVKLFYRSGDSGADFIKDIKMDDQNIWLATTNGVVVLNRKTGDFLRKFDISNGLPHNSINSILMSRDGYIYIGTESDKLFMIDKKFKISVRKAVMSGNTINKILSISQTTDGAIWAATRGNGVFKLLHDSVNSVNRSDDLMSNYCYSILADSEDYIWIGHEKGFSRLNYKTGIMKVFGGDFAKGGGCNQDGLFESADKKIFIGTTEGLIVYDRLKDRKTEIAPLNNINYITLNDVRYNYKPSFSLPYNKKYVLRVYYSGISFSSPDKVYYSTFLENFDADWSKMSTSRDVSYNLSFGKYKFSMASVNPEGLSREIPVSFDILISKPFWRAWWFILSAITSITAIIILFIRQRDKEQKKIQEYLERELEARTSVVMKQKGEIELQNIEITDSINYAKRIQSSILPDINKLKESFKDAFILFSPRDIVSGDFYWFDKLADDKFIIVCADSTGHGVPGAFMSMIGSTILQDIVTRKRISTPSEILKLLDKQIFSTLNQNVELGISNDGMDMVVCEFNIKTRHIRFASAMRPVIIVIGGESYYIKGNRSSVGGESVVEKFFDDQEYYLNEGDTVYMFSDGLPDQFGGTDGKKMKVARLKRVIEQVSKLPMNEQKEALYNFYLEWRGNYEQVDDILLMGIKV